MDRLHAYAPGWDYPKLNQKEHLTDHFGLVSELPQRVLEPVTHWKPGLRDAEQGSLGRSLERTRY